MSTPSSSSSSSLTYWPPPPADSPATSPCDWTPVRRRDWAGRRPPAVLHRSGTAGAQCSTRWADTTPASMTDNSSAVQLSKWPLTPVAVWLSQVRKRWRGSCSLSAFPLLWRNVDHSLSIFFYFLFLKMIYSTFMVLLLHKLSALSLLFMPAAPQTIQPYFLSSKLPLSGSHAPSGVLQETPLSVFVNVEIGWSMQITTPLPFILSSTHLRRRGVCVCVCVCSCQNKPTSSRL